VSVPSARDDLELAVRAARAAGEVLLSYFGRDPIGLASKSSATDPVSDADREAERTIRDLLAAERPDDGLVGEEGSHADAANGRRWIVDPLDGTVNFLYGFPAWAVSIALDDGRGSAVGVVHDPSRGETFTAIRGEGARLPREGSLEAAEIAMAVRPPTPLAQALVATGFSYEPARRERQAAIAHDLLPRVRDIRRAGAASLDLAWLAAGRVDAYFERGLHLWDWAAGRLLVEEAGGVVRDLDGEPHGLLAASSAELCDELGAVAGAPLDV
jgi:myo-inositol-1(or 4)-monophosphatase